MYQAVYYFFTFIAGTFFGSFLNVVSDRSVSGESILFGRSHCDHCKKTLTAKNLIPLVSFIIQKGKCDNCKKKLSIYYPLSEVITGLMLVLAAYISGIFVDFNFGSILSLVFFFVVFSFYIVLFLTDLKYRLLPNKVVFAGIMFILLFVFLSTSLELFLTYKTWSADPFGQYLLKLGFLEQQFIKALTSFLVMVGSAFGISAFFALLFFVTKGRGMGGGDMKLGFLIGLFNRYPDNILAIFLGFVIGALYSVVLIILKKKSIKDTVAFGPFLIIGSVIALLFGPQIINWYLGQI